MRANIFIEEDFASLFVRIESANAKKQPEVFSEILKKLGLIVESERSSSFEENLDFVTAI